MISSANRALAAERTKQIVDLHLGIQASMRRSVQDAIKLGELLTQQKDALPHGDFLSWVDRELPFAERTARRYMSLFEHRTKTASVADLTTAYQVAQIEDQRQHPKARPVDPAAVEKQRQRHQDFVNRMQQGEADSSAPAPRGPVLDDSRRAGAPPQPAPAAATAPPPDNAELLDRARKRLEDARRRDAEDAAGDANPEAIVADTISFCESQFTRTKGSGQHMLVNEMVKFWRQKSIELNRKAGAA